MIKTKHSNKINLTGQEKGMMQKICEAKVPLWLI
jgi:hypothetical protein